MQSQPIYKKDSAGRLRQWSYEVEGDRYRTTSGLMTGKLTTTPWTVCTPKSQPTAADQALFEAQAEEKKKLDRVYRPTLAELEAGKDMMFSPMLAKSYKKPPKFPVFVQPKLDGMRCIARAEGLFSRTGRPITGLPHIERSLQHVFEQFPDVILDGELYSHDLKDEFEEIISIARKSNSIDPRSEQISLHVYDMYDGNDLNFGDRIQWVDDYLCGLPGIRFVETATVSDERHMISYYDLWLAQGYEGMMVRLDKPYDQGKRSSSLLKMKLFEDDEFRILEVIEGTGTWAGRAKSLKLDIGDGMTCDCGASGDFAFTEQMLIDREDWIGRLVTVQFQGRTKYGKLRTPTVKRYHGTERGDI